MPGGVHLRVWAPAWRRVTLVLDDDPREIALARDDAGYFSRFVEGLGAGTRYRYRLDADPQLYADPASRFQPEGPFGPSEVIDPGEYVWTDAAWRGITQPHRQGMYELHVGTFTRAGTRAAAAQHLPYLADLGVTTIEMMPIAEFAGRRNWGYDGVELFAPTHNYGRPAELRAFVDRAHALGIAVVLDVVYNHLGPAGNSLFVFAPPFIANRARTAWGETIDFAVPQVRELFVANAGYWIDEFHLDGLRVDATHAIHDDSEPHVLAEIVRRARDSAGQRRIFVVAENEPQDTALLDHGLDALANDDFHHAARVAELGVTDGYLHDYRGTPQELISATEHGFLYQGQLYAWQRNTRGTPTRGLPPSRFVHFLENHDQIANAGFGERLADALRSGDAPSRDDRAAPTRARDPDAVPGPGDRLDTPVVVLRRSRSRARGRRASRPRAVRRAIGAARDTRVPGGAARSQRTRDIRGVRPRRDRAASRPADDRAPPRSDRAAQRRSHVHDRAPRRRGAVGARVLPPLGGAPAAREPRPHVPDQRAAGIAARTAARLRLARRVVERASALRRPRHADTVHAGAPRDPGARGRVVRADPAGRVRCCVEPPRSSHERRGSAGRA